MNSDKVNAVAIFTQRYLHGKMAIKALKAGKHVYSAVPCSVEVDDIVEMYINDEFFEKPSNTYDFMYASKKLNIIYEDRNIILTGKIHLHLNL